MQSRITFRTLRGDTVEAYLAPEIMDVVRDMAARRRESARAKGRQQANFIEGTTWDSLDTEVQSMAAEYVVAHYFDDFEYEPVIGHPDRKEGDLVVREHPIEVKSTSREHGSLIVPKKALSRPYVLVVSNPPLATIRGWIFSDEAKRDEWFRKDVRSPAYFVPQSALMPIAYLTDAL
jgi:hypothetical protein